MTDKLVAYTHNGQVCLFIPAKQCRLPGEGEIQWLSRCIARAVPSEAEDAIIVTADALPKDRRFRNAWSIVDGQIIVDMSKARELHKTRIRRVRDRALRDADVTALRHIGNPDELERIEKEKQALRDLTAHPDIEAAQTPDELYAAWPAGMRRTSDFVSAKQFARVPAALPSAPALPIDSGPALLELPAETTRPTPQRPGWLGKVLHRAANELEPNAGHTDIAPPETVEVPAAVAAAPDEVVMAVSLAMTLDDAARRRLAQDKLSKCVDEWMAKTFSQHRRYELAVQALNDLPFALEIFEPEAKERGIGIQELCREIVTEHQAAQRRMGHVYTIKARALTDINAATGDDIDAIAGTAAATIMGE